MRLIVIGCENVGKTTLVDNLQKWGTKTGFPFHMDDHFTFPSHRLSDEEQRKMNDLGPVVRERFQRFQIYYHIPILLKYDHVLITGMHIEEAIFGPKYYYSQRPLQQYDRKIELEFPKDTTLVHLTATPDVIRERKKTSNHLYPVVPEQDIEEICKAFAQEYRASWIPRKFEIDTTALNPMQVMKECLTLVRPHLSEQDLLRLSVTSITDDLDT